MVPVRTSKLIERNLYIVKEHGRSKLAQTPLRTKVWAHESLYYPNPDTDGGRYAHGTSKASVFGALGVGIAVRLARYYVIQHGSLRFTTLLGSCGGTGLSMPT